VQSKPSSLPPGLAAGAKHLYDDFVAIHMNQTIFIHLSVRAGSNGSSVALSFPLA